FYGSPLLSNCLFLFITLPLTLTSSLFPYTTLFRSRHCYFICLHQGFHHSHNYFEASHIAAGSFRNAQNHWLLFFLSCLKYCLNILQVINIELSYCILIFFCFYEHFFH